MRKYRKTNANENSYISETLIIGYDANSSNSDFSCMVVEKHTGCGLKHIATLYGKDAEELYSKLTKKEINHE